MQKQRRSSNGLNWASPPGKHLSWAVPAGAVGANAPQPSKAQALKKNQNCYSEILRQICFVQTDWSAENAAVLSALCLECTNVRRTVWRCCSRLEFGKAYCHRSSTIDEAALHRSIVSAINQYIEKQRKSPAKTSPPKPLVTDDMNYSRHISEMQSDAQQFRFDEIKSWLSAHRDGIQCYDDQAVRLLVQKITVVSKDMISVKFYGRRGKIVVIL